MGTTIRIAEDRLAEYFDGLTKRLLKDGSPEAIDVEVLAPDLGDQFVTKGARLIGITYDLHAKSLEFAFDAGDHRITNPREVWAIEEADGFVSSIEVVRQDGTREVIGVRPVGLRRIETPGSAPSSKSRR